MPDPGAPFAGEFADGRRAERRPVGVRCDAAGLLLEEAAGAPLAHWPYAALSRIDDDSAGGPVRLAHGDARLTVAAPEFEARLRQDAPHLVRPGLWRRLARAGLAAALALALGAAAWVGVPRASGVVAALLPASLEQALGDGILADIPGKRCADPAGIAALDRLTARLTAGQGVPYALRIEVRDITQINALAAPGGRIVIFKGLLAEAQTADEVAGVLGHELTHTLRRHSTSLLIRVLGFSLVLDAMVGSGSAGNNIAQILLALAYTRGNEEEADVGALQMLDAAAIPREGFANFFDRLAARNGAGKVPAFLTTHPPPAERSARARAGHAAATRPALSDADWHDLKEICNTLE